MSMMQYMAYALVLIHTVLLGWAMGGIAEMITPHIPWKPYTNPAFPHWVLILHWGSVSIASLGFLLGYATHWTKTPLFMTMAYGLMALVCVIETFGYMTNSTKYMAMGAEFAAYIVILLLLFKSDHFTGHFKLTA
jgi:hypothetical protein